MTSLLTISVSRHIRKIRIRLPTLFTVVRHFHFLLVEVFNKDFYSALQTIPNIKLAGDNKRRLLLVVGTPQKKRGVSATYSIAVRQNLYGINAKTHAIGRESMPLSLPYIQNFADFD